MKTKVLDVAALPLLTPTLVTVDGEDVVLYRRGSEIFALGNECPHQGGNLCDGWIEGDILSCPLHGWEFDVRTGRSWCDPKRMRLMNYAVTVEPGARLVEGPYVAETFPVTVEDEYVVVET